MLHPSQAGRENPKAEELGWAGRDAENNIPPGKNIHLVPLDLGKAKSCFSCAPKGLQLITGLNSGGKTSKGRIYFSQDTGHGSVLLCKNLHTDNIPCPGVSSSQLSPPFKLKFYMSKIKLLFLFSSTCLLDFRENTWGRLRTTSHLQSFTENSLYWP